MRTWHRILLAWMAFFLFIQAVFGLVLLFFGLSDQRGIYLEHWLSKGNLHLVFVGGLLIVLAFLFGVITIRLDRREYYRVKMGVSGEEADIDLDVVRSLVGRYWQTNFPTVKPQVDAFLRSDQSLELFVDLPKNSIEEQAELLQKIESDLGCQFARHLGYRRPFFITVWC